MTALEDAQKPYGYFGNYRDFTYATAAEAYAVGMLSGTLAGGDTFGDDDDPGAQPPIDPFDDGMDASGKAHACAEIEEEIAVSRMLLRARGFTVADMPT